MKHVSWRKYCGVTLVEMLLVLVIITSIIMVAARYMQQRAETARIDRTVVQMEYILNAGLSFYVANKKWPGDPDGWYTTVSANSSPLQPDFLPPQPVTNPWNRTSPEGVENYYWHRYGPTVYSNMPANVFQVWVYVGTSAANQQLGNIIAAKFPFAYYTLDTDPYPGYVVAYVNIPTQDLNSAMAVSFAGLYHHGACVPVPNCPSTVNGAAMTLQPQIFVIPVSVSGVNDPAPGDSNVYPISSFTAYATENNTFPDACHGQNTTQVPCEPLSGDAPPPDQQYWRVCMQVITERGDVQVTSGTEAWGDRVTLAAFTRCGISNEAAGSSFQVFSH